MYSIVKGEKLGDSRCPRLPLEKRDVVYLRKTAPPLLSSGTSMVFLERGPRRAASKRHLEAQRVLGKW